MYIGLTGRAGIRKSCHILSHNKPAMRTRNKRLMQKIVMIYVAKEKIFL